MPVTLTAELREMLDAIDASVARLQSIRQKAADAMVGLVPQTGETR